MAHAIKSRNGLHKAYNRAPASIRGYFKHMPELIDAFAYTVCLAYAFAQLALAQNMALYCGFVKLFRADAELARRAVGTHHMTREGFVDLYKVVFGFDLPQSAASALKTAEEMRDHVMHGKPTTDDRIRNAIARVLEYAAAINQQLKGSCGVEPFGELRGFAGAAKKLDKRTTRFMLKGMGFALG